MNKIFHLRTLVLICALVITFNLSGKNQISGRITDATNQPLIGVNVVLKGTQKGTISDENGELS